MIPVLLRRPKGRWVNLHYGYMAWSYVGLLAATEIAVRVPWVRPRSPGMFLALVASCTGSLHAHDVCKARGARRYNSKLA